MTSKYVSTRAFRLFLYGQGAFDARCAFCHGLTRIFIGGDLRGLNLLYSTVHTVACSAASPASFLPCRARLSIAQSRHPHVRKRSEGSGVDTSSRWPGMGISREEKGKWLINEYDKVRVRCVYVTGMLCCWALSASVCPSLRLPFPPRGRARTRVCFACFFFFPDIFLV